MPSFMRAVKRRLTETSSWASVSRPLWTASVSLRYSVPQSVSVPARMPAAEPAAKSAE